MPAKFGAYYALKYRLSLVKRGDTAPKAPSITAVYSVPFVHHFSTQNRGTASVYSYGKGFLGSLGTSTYDDIQAPTAIMKDTSIRSISSGW